MQHALAFDFAGAQALGGFGRPPPVAAHDMTAAHDELAAGAMRQPLAFAVDEPVLLVGNAAPHAVGPTVGFVGRQEADALALRHAIHQEQARLG